MSATAWHVVTAARPSEDSPLKFDPDAPGWVTNGFLAVRTDMSTDGLKKTTGIAKTIKSIAGLPREVATEDAALRIENVAHAVAEYEDSCDGCECGACPGERGTRVDRIDVEIGQRVYATAKGERVLCDPGFAMLLDGLTVYLVGKIGGDLYRDPRMLVGFDADDAPATIVMPRRGEPREVAP